MYTQGDLMDNISLKQLYEALIGSLKDDRRIIAEIRQIAESMRTKCADADLRESAVSILSKIDVLEGDVANEVRTSDGLYQKALSDGLTGLRNRLFLEDVAKPDLENKENVSYLMVDIDHFKDYNDMFRHQQGDAALRTVAKVIRRICEHDTAIRYGGEEFSIILVGYEDTRRQVRDNAEAIRETVEKSIIMPFLNPPITDILCNKAEVPKTLKKRAKVQMIKFFEDQEVCPDNYNIVLEHYFRQFATPVYDSLASRIRSLQRITVSIGGASRKPRESLVELIDRADEALYQAKEAGRNRVVIR